jgi:hypothetical protein
MSPVLILFARIAAPSGSLASSAASTNSRCCTSWTRRRHWPAGSIAFAAPSAALASSTVP